MATFDEIEAILEKAKELDSQNKKRYNDLPEKTKSNIQMYLEEDFSKKIDEHIKEAKENDLSDGMLTMLKMLVDKELKTQIEIKVFLDSLYSTLGSIMQASAVSKIEQLNGDIDKISELCQSIEKELLEPIPGFEIEPWMTKCEKL